MKEQDIINGCNLVISSNKGISLREEYLLKNQICIYPSRHKMLNHVELVSLAIQTIYTVLGRKNITPRDLKKAVVDMIKI